MSSAPRNLRAEMPWVASKIDELRDAFGADGINALIKGGMQGVPTFYARENGHEVGTPYVLRGREISVAQMVIESIQFESLKGAKDENRNTRHR